MEQGGSVLDSCSSSIWKSGYKGRGGVSGRWLGFGRWRCGVFFFEVLETARTFQGFMGVVDSPSLARSSKVGVYVLNIVSPSSPIVRR